MNAIHNKIHQQEQKGLLVSSHFNKIQQNVHLLHSISFSVEVNLELSKFSSFVE